MAFPSHVPRLRCMGAWKHLVRTPSRNLFITTTTTSLSRSLAPKMNHHGGPTPTLSLTNLHCGGVRTSSSSSQPSTQPNSPSPQPSGPVPSPTRLICGNPFTDDATEDAARQRILQQMADNNPLYQPIMRQACFEATIHWLQDNFPEETGPRNTAAALPWRAPALLWWQNPSDASRRFFRYEHAGPFPKTISYAAADGGGADKAPMTTISWDDTRLIFVSRSGGPTTRVGGIKQGGTVCVAITVLPPARLGEGETAAVMRAAETALLAFLKEAQDVGYLGSPPIGAELEGCLAFVFLGGDVSVSEYSSERGLFDPPGGFEFEHKKVDPAPLPPLPGTEEYERWRTLRWF